MDTAMAASHREAFLRALPKGSVALLATGGEQVRSRDTHFRFRPDSDFWYLTAFPEPDAVAVLRPDRDEGRFVLFVRPRNKELEIWNGLRAGVEGAKERYGADEAHPIEALDEVLPGLLKGARKLYYRAGVDLASDQRLLPLLQRINARTRDGVTAPSTIVDPGTVLHEMRLFKSADELQVLRRAAAITDRAHRGAMAALQEGQPEYELEALVDGIFRHAGGWGPGYETICASGANACILHYTDNDAIVPRGALLLLDAGCELEGYTADVTRTFPAAGRFSPPQRELYEVVLAAQLAALQQAVPGVAFDEVHRAALERLVGGLLELGLLKGSLEENLESQDYKRYYMHRTSHWLGLDVHDVGRYHGEAQADGPPPSRRLEPGMVLTVEPGLYVAQDDEQAPEAFRGIGIRIEDDVAITSDGHEVLTAATPKSIEEVEAACGALAEVSSGSTR